LCNTKEELETTENTNVIDEKNNVNEQKVNVDQVTDVTEKICDNEEKVVNEGKDTDGGDEEAGDEEDRDEEVEEDGDEEDGDEEAEEDGDEETEEDGDEEDGDEEDESDTDGSVEEDEEENESYESSDVESRGDEVGCEKCEEGGIFVINIDDKPVFYTLDRNDVMNKMILIAGTIAKRERRKDSSIYTTVKTNMVEISSAYNFFVVKYERVIHRITVNVALCID